MSHVIQLTHNPSYHSWTFSCVATMPAVRAAQPLPPGPPTATARMRAPAAGSPPALHAAARKPHARDATWPCCKAKHAQGSSSAALHTHQHMAGQAALLSRALRSPTLARGLRRRRDVPLCRDHSNMHATAAAMPAACRTHGHAVHRTRATRRRGRTRARAARAAHAHARTRQAHAAGLPILRRSCTVLAPRAYLVPVSDRAAQTD